jgi:hypothetical protein
VGELEGKLREFRGGKEMRRNEVRRVLWSDGFGMEENEWRWEKCGKERYEADKVAVLKRSCNCYDFDERN